MWCHRYLETLINLYLSDSVSIITPTDPAARGCQLSLVLRQNVKEVHQLLDKESVIVDVREPHAMRVAPAPLYNSFEDVREFVLVLRDVLKVVDAHEAEAAAKTA